MRKAVAEGRSASLRLSTALLEKLNANGYPFVQVKWLTPDRHYDFVVPESIVLIPMRKLPDDPSKKDVYERTDSDLLKQWAENNSNTIQVFISKKK